MDLSTIQTYIYIDVSNIRYACRWSLGFEIDFVKLYRYLKKKYPNVKDIRYYEGIAPEDAKRKNHFKFLNERIGYTVCPLWRKSYISPAKYEVFKCQNCGFKNKVQILPKIKKMKSNIDVYLTADMLEIASKVASPMHIIILSCDGDYAEAIKSVLRISPDSKLTVLATPMTKKNNCLSARLSQLVGELGRSRYRLVDINNIREYISY